METRVGDIVIPHDEQTPEGFVKALAEAQRHAKRMRAELSKALGSLDELDKIVEMATETTLFEEDYHDYAKAASDALWQATEDSNRALSHGGEAGNHIFAILRVFMCRRWRAIRESRDTTQLKTTQQ